MDDKEKRFVEELLDASLRNYAAAEPRLGLEGRVLAGVRTRQQAGRRRVAWLWAAGVAGAAALVTLLVFPHRQPTPLPVTVQAPASLSAPTVARIAPAAALPAPRQRQRYAAAKWVDWRPQQFPTPRPLSEQEKLLVAYAQAIKGSPAASAPNAEPDLEHDLEIPPLSIAAIKIEPLAREDDGEEKDK